MHQRTVPCQYFAPQKIEEAVEILSRYGKEIRVLAGGTDLLVQYYDRLYEINGWLDLKNIKELKDIRINKRWSLIPNWKNPKILKSTFQS